MITHPATLGLPTPVASRREFQELVGFLGEGAREVTRIETDLSEAIASAQAKAEAALTPLRAAMAEAQARVQRYCVRDPGALHQAVEAGVEGLEPYQAQLAAMLATSARPVSARQREILRAMQIGAVLRRINGRRQFDLIWSPTIPRESRFPAPWGMTSNHVFDLQARFLDAFDPATGEPLITAAAHERRPLEFRLKPDVELP